MTTYTYVVYATCGCRVAKCDGDGQATALWLLAWMKSCAYIVRVPDWEAALDDCTHEHKEVTQLKLI